MESTCIYCKTVHRVEGVYCPEYRKAKSIIVGTDFAKKLKWWQRVLVWLGFKNRWTDYSCVTIWKRNKDGTMEMVDAKTFLFHE